MSPEYARPYVKAQKNDDRDAEAIAEAATRPTMRFVELKSEEQLDMQTASHPRQTCGERTALINQLRAIHFRTGAAQSRTRIRCDDVRRGRSRSQSTTAPAGRGHTGGMARSRSTHCRLEFAARAKTDEAARRLATIPRLSGFPCKGRFRYANLNLPSNMIANCAFAGLDEAPPAAAEHGGEQHDIKILKSMPGIGRINLAILLAEASGPLSRRDYQALRTLSGVAPVTKQSGKSRVVVRRYAAHVRLRDAVYHWARVATQHDPKSRSRYVALRQRGHSHGRAIRGVADRLLALACTLLQRQTVFDPDFGTPEVT